MKDRIFVVPHTHYEGAVFRTRAEYLESDLPSILQALHLLRVDSDYRFVLDQTAYIKPFFERFPEEVPTFRAMVDEGRLEITGGMDVMADENLPSGESWVRQVLYGKRFARERIGVDVKVGWGLDTFGHHPQMPQLLRRAGYSSYFFFRGVPDGTQGTEFLWEGIDGTAILACWLPFSYALLKPVPGSDREFAEMVLGLWERLRPISGQANLLALSGSDMEVPEPMMERVRAFNRRDHPVELVVATPSEFLSTVDANALPRRRLDLNPVFPGCYSSRIRGKQENRRLEGLLLSCESLEAIAAWAGDGMGVLPRGDLLDLWEPVLFNQVHDVMCGVQTDPVWEDTRRAHHAVGQAASVRLDEGLDALAALVDTSGPGVPLLVFNPLGWDRRDAVEVDVGFAGEVESVGVVDDEGRPVPCDIVAEERHPDGALKRARLLWIAEVPALGYRTYHAVPGASREWRTDVSSNAAGRDPYPGSRRGARSVHVMTGVLENDHLRVVIDLWSGAITSLVDRRSGRELLDTSVFPGVVVTKEPDHGDPWEPNSILRGGIPVASDRRIPVPSPQTADLSSSYNGGGWTRHGAVMAEFAVSHPFGEGWVSVSVRLYSGIPRVDVRIGLRNQEKWVRYRALVPTSIRNGRMTQEIPFGAAERDEREFPAQTWTDLGDGEVGLTVLNRGTPGNEVRGNLMLTSLLRAVRFLRYATPHGADPSLISDTGFEIGVEHSFDLALVPHAGHWRTAGLSALGQGFNRPLVVRKGRPHPGRLPPSASFVRVSDPDVLVTALKPGPDGDVIVRLYESTGQARPGLALAFVRPVRRADETDLLEQPIGAARLEDGRVRLDLGPWEIKTLRVEIEPL